MSTMPFKLPLQSEMSASASSVDFLPVGFKPSTKDIICGRARENFHHDGNRYFRDLIQENVGAYLTARTKIEKSEAIALIVDKVHQASPYGGFIKKDSSTARWYKIKDNEARDKVGHAIRKAVQRLEETRPKLAARIKKDYTLTSSQADEQRTDKQPAPYKSRIAGASAQQSSPPTFQHKNKEEGKLSPAFKNVEPTGFTDSLRAFAARYAVVPSVGSATRALAQDATKVALGHLGRATSADPAFPARSLLAMANSLPGHNAAVFPSPGNISMMDDPARLVAATLISGIPPNIFQRAAPLAHAYNQYIGMSSPATANKLWLPAALRERQETLAALRDFQYAAAHSGEARATGRKLPMDGEDKTV